VRSPNNAFTFMSLSKSGSCLRCSYSDYGEDKEALATENRTATRPKLGLKGPVSRRRDESTVVVSEVATLFF